MKIPGDDDYNNGDNEENSSLSISRQLSDWQPTCPTYTSSNSVVIHQTISKNRSKGLLNGKYTKCKSYKVNEGNVCNEEVCGECG